MDKGGRDDDTGAKLFQDNEDGVCLGGHPIDHDNREVNTNGTGDEDDEEQTDSERNVVVAGDLVAAPRAAALALTTTDAVLNTGVEVAVLPLRALVCGILGGTFGHDLHLVTAGCDAVRVRAVRVAASEGGGDGRGGRVGRRGHDLVLGGAPHAKAEYVSGKLWIRIPITYTVTPCRWQPDTAVGAPVSAAAVVVAAVAAGALAAVTRTSPSS